MTRRERRRAVRRTPGAEEMLSSIRLRAGRELAVIDVSCGGVLVEGDVRLLPGTHTDVHVLTASGRVLVRSRVVRAYVAGLWGNRIVYRGALAFEHPVDVGGEYEMAAASNDRSDREGRQRPHCRPA